MVPGYLDLPRLGTGWKLGGVGFPGTGDGAGTRSRDGYATVAAD